MNRKLLKSFATTTHAELLKIVNVELDSLLTKQAKQIPAAFRHRYDDFILRVKSVTAGEAAEQITYTIFNQLIFLRFLETHHWLPELVIADDQLTELWQEPDVTLRIIAKLETALPEIFAKPILTAEFLDLANPEFLPQILTTMAQAFERLEPDSFAPVESLGWLYQYYNSNEKTRLVKLKKPYKKSAVPIVTQIFTPKFIVQYLVDNSLGRFLVEHHFLPADYEFQFSADAFTPATTTTSTLASSPTPTSTSMPSLTPTQTPSLAELIQVKLIDPCCGSGHILVTAFELFYQAYKNLGAAPADIATLILQHNIYGLDIDEFAVQIARAVLIFTARLHDEKFFLRRQNLVLHVFAIPESNLLGNAILSAIDDDGARQEALELFNFFDNAGELGSLLLPAQQTFPKLTALSKANTRIAQTFQSMLDVFYLLSETYQLTVTNPPYINAGLMNAYLKRYIHNHFNKFNRDVFACFIKRAENFTTPNGYFAAMTPNVWLTTSSFTHLREHLLDETQTTTLLSLAPGTFFEEAVVDVVAFVAKKLPANANQETPLNVVKKLPANVNQKTPSNIAQESSSHASQKGEKSHHNSASNHPTTFIKLFEKGDLNTAEREFKNARLDYFLLARLAKTPGKITQNFYRWPQQIFRQLPDSIIAFAAPSKLLHILERSPSLATYAEPRQGIITGDNAQFLHFWYEVDPTSLAVPPKFLADPTSLAVPPKLLTSTQGKNPTNPEPESSPTWFPHNKGGNYRKWYGNQAYVINWSDDGREIKNHKSGDNKLSRVQNLAYNFRESVSWSAVTSGDFSARYYDETFTFNVAGPSCFAPPSLQKYLLGFLNSCVAAEFTKILNPTMNFNVGDIAKIPFIYDKTYQPEINRLVDQNLALTKQDYDSNELSWNFTTHPLLADSMEDNLLSAAYATWRETCKNSARQLQQNEERLNEIFIQIYQLDDVLKPQVDPAKISLHLPDEKFAAASLLSFFMGAELGRYNQSQSASEIIFTSTSDTLNRLEKFLTKNCGADSLASNLRWLADSLGCPVAVTVRDFLQEYFVNDFWPAHRATYHDKPIYWQIDSGPEHAVRGFCYAHNFTPAILLEKLLKHIDVTQENFLTELDALETKKQRTIWPTERRRFELAQGKIVNKLRELNDFYQKVIALDNQKISLDFNAGITKNYEKLAPILTALKPSRYMQKKRALLAKGNQGK